jgi:uncharacterized membrane protein (UPF0182 family)
LTIDSDPYPAIVDNDGPGGKSARIVWILDGYTMSANYPMSQRVELDDATSDALTPQPAIVGQPSEQVNYIRNSVKAVVDAYDGGVDLYAWDESDPMLRTWMKAYPGTVKAKSEMPDQLLDHVRYPEDLMKVQREVLGQYHVENARTFYNGTERWRVPADPTQEGSRKQPAYYLSVRMPEEQEPSFSLTSTYIYFNRQNLAAFVAVNADARSDDYGKISILQLDEDTRIDGPAQVANKLQTDPAVARELLPLRQNQLQINHGNLLTLPVGGGLLYVQPIYVQRRGEGTYPVLQLVVASFGGKIGVGNTLQQALDQVFSGDSGAETGEEPTENPPPSTGEEPPPSTGPPSSEVQKALNEANAAFAEADAALKKGDLQGYAEAVTKAKAAVARAVEAQQKEAQPSPSGTPAAPSPSGTPATG